jgi:hypothetical protein
MSGFAAIFRSTNFGGMSLFRLAACRRCFMTPEPDGILPFKTPQTNADVPHWDSVNRKLYFRGELVKAFTSPADHQESILDVLEALGWPPSAAAPTLGSTDEEQHVRMERAVRRLNGRQHTRLLVFHVRARGKIITWEHFLEKTSVPEVTCEQGDAKD